MASVSIPRIDAEGNTSLELKALGAGSSKKWEDEMVSTFYGDDLKNQSTPKTDKGVVMKSGYSRK